MRSKRIRLRTALSNEAHFLRTRVAEERGATLVEFALIAPLLLALLFGIFWIGRAYNVYQTITRAAREGARYAVLPSCAGCGNTYADTYTAAGACLDTSTNAFTNFVAPALAASSIDPNQVSGYCQKADWLENTTPRVCGVIVTFSYPVQVAIPFTNLNGATLNIRTEARMRMENQSADAGGNRTCP